jgi:hypothetical protein
MVWLAYGMYTGQERLGYMRRGGPSVEEDAATIANVWVSVFPNLR